MSYEFEYERQNQFIPTNCCCSVYLYHLIQFEQECFVLVFSCSNRLLRGEEKSETLTVASQISDLVNKIQNGVVRGRIYNSFKSNFR